MDGCSSIKCGRSNMAGLSPSSRVTSSKDSGGELGISVGDKLQVGGSLALGGSNP